MSLFARVSDISASALKVYGVQSHGCSNYPSLLPEPVEHAS